MLPKKNCACPIEDFGIKKFQEMKCKEQNLFEERSYELFCFSEVK
jgi:hypothetical protein